MVHNLNPKNLHINGLFFGGGFLQNQKNPIFGMILSITPKMRQNPGKLHVDELLDKAASLQPAHLTSKDLTCVSLDLQIANYL